MNTLHTQINVTEKPKLKAYVEIIMQFIGSCPWNAPLPVLCWLINTGKLQSGIFLKEVLEFNRGIVTCEFIYLYYTG